MLDRLFVNSRNFIGLAVYHHFEGALVAFLSGGASRTFIEAWPSRIERSHEALHVFSLKQFLDSPLLSLRSGQNRVLSGIAWLTSSMLSLTSCFHHRLNEGR